MSMSLFVVLALGVEPNTDELNQFAKENGHNIVYTQNVVIKEHSGFLPVKLNSQDAGVELHFFPTSELPEPFKLVVPKNYSEGIVYQLRFGSNPIEAQTAFTTAVILTSKYNGVVIDDQSGSLMSVEQLKQALSYFSGFIMSTYNQAILRNSVCCHVLCGAQKTPSHSVRKLQRYATEVI